MSDLKNETSALWRTLLDASPGRANGREQDEISPLFHEYIAALCRERGQAPEGVLGRANIEKGFGRALFRGSCEPSRDTVIRLAFGFEADLELTQTLLRRAGHSPLYPRVRRDVVIGFCLARQTSFSDTQKVLMQKGLPMIGGNRER